MALIASFSLPIFSNSATALLLARLVVILLSIWILWSLFLRTLLLRRFYENQGIPFIRNCYALIGAEIEVTKLHERNKSHDSLYLSQDTNIIGTVRGNTVQLYTV